MKSIIRNKVLLISFVFVMFLSFFSLVSAGSQPTQQFNKIFLNPFYTPSMSINTNYTYNITLNPPDGLSAVKSAIINFDIWMTPTVTFQLWVNNRTCNNPTYVISTTFASAGRAVATFDCSNIINQSGVYTITFKPTQAGTGSSTAWLDLTYMNNPIGTVDVHGTEYIPGDDGKMFLQFLDANQQAIDNSACLVSLWYPNGTYFVNSSAMTHLSEGIYYYNFLVPSMLGVYPAAARCYLPYQFSTAPILRNVTETWESNTFTGGTGWDNSILNNSINGWDYYGATIFTSAGAGTGGCYSGTYCVGMNGESFSGQYLERGFVTPQNVQKMVITFYLKSTMGTSDTMTYDIFDGTWHNMDTYYGANFTTGVWQMRQYNLTVEAGYNLDSTAILQGFFGKSFTANNKYLFMDNLTVDYYVYNTTISNTSAYQVLLGSGEVHVSGLLNNLTNSMSNNINVTAGQIWNYPNRNLTFIDTNNIARNVWNYTDRNLTYYQDVTNYTKVGESVWTSSATISVGLLNQLAAAIWSYGARNLTYYPTQVDLTNYTLIAQTVWNAASRNLTYYPTQTDMTNYTLLQLYFSQVPPAVWNYSIRNLTDYQDMTNYTLIGEDITTATNLILNDIDNVPLNVWNFTDRNLTYYQNFGDQTNYSRIILGVWNATDRNLTYYPAQVDLTNYSLIIGETANAVWNATDRNLTYYPQQMDLTNYSQVAEVVWNAANRNLTYYQDVTDYDKIIVGVWNYTTRNLTFYPAQVDMTNYTRIDETILAVNQTLFDKITSSTTAILFFLDDMNTTLTSDILSIPTLVWTFNDRNLTYYPTQVDMTNYTLMAETVWNNAVRNLTFYPTQVDLTNYTQIIEGVTTSVWNATNRSLTLYVDTTNYSNIVIGVWNATDRNLTFYPTQVDLTNYTEIARVVWNATDRNLTYYQNFGDQTNYTAIILGVWNATDRNLTYYPAQVDMTNYTAIYENVVNGVWNATDRNLTFYPTAIDLTNYTQIVEMVWNATDRNLTYYQDVTDYNKIILGVWNATDRNLTFYPVQVDLTNYTKIAQDTSFAVWNATDRNLTYYELSAVNYTLIAETVWNNAIRNLTYYPAQMDLTNYTKIAEDTTVAVWNATDRNLTYYQNFGDQTNYTQIVIGVWTATDRNLTFYPAQVDLTNYSAITENVVGGVWNATDRNLTFYPTAVDLTNYTQIAETVWGAPSRNLTYTQDVTDYNRIIVGVWNATDRNLTFYPAQVDMTNYTLIGEMIANNSINYTLVADNVWQWNGVIIQNILDQIGSSSSQYVWNATDRNLTYYPTVTDMTNYTKIAEEVWNAATRNLTYYQNFGDQTNYTSIIVGVWNATDRNLTYYPAQIDMTNYTAIYENVVNGVWNATDRNLTFYPTAVDLTNYTQIAETVWNAIDRNLTYTADVTDYNKIIIGVWNATDRNLTFYPVQVDMTNYTKIAEDTSAAVWNATDRNLTFYPTMTDLTNYTLIAETVWNTAVRNLTYYPDMTDYNQIIIGVWNATDRNLTYYPAQVDMTNYTLITDNVVNGVWNATDRNLTFYPTAVDLTNYTQIAETVWSASNRNLTYTQDVTDYNKIIVGVWNATDRNLTFYPAQVDMTNYTLIGEIVANNSINYTLVADNVWQWNGVIIQNLLDQIGSSTAQNVWNATDRNLTYYAPTPVNYTLIAESVWQNLNRTLTDFNFTVTANVNETAIANAVWASVDRTLTSFNFTVNATMDINNTALADAVWNAVNRTLTDYNQSDLTNYTMIQTMVWNATDRNLTYYQNFGDQTNYTLISDVVWNATMRTLTEMNVTINSTEIADAVWSSVNRTLTNYNNSDLTNYTLIQEMVWNASSRTLTDFNFTVNATMSINNTALADAVWNAVNRTLTDYNQTDLTDYGKIQTMVWNATDRNLTYYQNFGDQTNYTIISEVVWNATTRTLTQMNITINSTEIAEAVWANSIRTLTDFNFTVNATINNSAVASAVWAYSNKTVDFATTGTTQNVTTVEDIANMGHTYVGGTEYIDGDNGKIAIRLVRGTGALAFVETGANCSVSITYPNASYYIFNASMNELGEGAYTYDFTVPPVLGIYPYFTNCYIEDRKYFSLDDFHVYANNYSSIAPSVWNYTTRNLTNNGNDISASDVWNYATRELTYYPTANLTLSNESIQQLGDAVWNYTGTINPNILTQISGAVTCKLENLLSGMNLKWGVRLNTC